MLARLLGALLGIDGLGRQSAPLDDLLCDWGGGAPSRWTESVSPDRPPHRLPLSR